MQFDNLAAKSLRKACLDLIPEPEPHEPCDSQEYRFAAIIGFSGDHVRGTLGLTTTTGGLRRVSKYLGAEDCPSGAEDSLGELSNQLLGHMKRSFTAHGVLITMATPLVVRGSTIEICGRTQGRWFQEVSAKDNDQVTVWFDAHVDENISISAEAIECGMANQGDAILF